MSEIDPSTEETLSPVPNSVEVWDLGVRLFHWALVALVITAVVTVKIGGNAMPYHSYCGYAILTLVLFRILWGFAGGTNARFTSFVTGPGQVMAYLKTLFKRDHGSVEGGSHAHHPGTYGHNPMGALSVLAMLAALLFQAVSGLFVNDDILFEGPLYAWVGKDLSDKITGWHKFNEKIIILLVVTHIAAILFYFFYKKDNLISPLISGVRKVTGKVPAMRAGSPVMAAVLLGISALAVYLLVNAIKLFGK